jgi:hypothetical protein
VLPAEAHLPGHPAGLRVRHVTGAGGAPLLLVRTAGEVATALRPAGGESDTALVLRVDDAPPVAGAPWRGRLVEVDVDDFRDAEPDPLHRYEADLLADLGAHHADQLTDLVSRCAGGPAAAGWHAVRVDRYGLVLAPRRGRCAARRLRVTFPRPVDSVPDLARTLHRILCHGDRVGQGPRSHNSR